MLDRLADRTRLSMVREHPLPFLPEPLTTVGVELMRCRLDRADHLNRRREPIIRAFDALGADFDS